MPVVGALFGIIVSAINIALQFLLRSVLVKFVVFFALYFVVTGFVAVLSNSGLLPNASTISNSLNGIPGDVWYFLKIFGCDFGLKMIISAMVARFIIRRIPLIG